MYEILERVSGTAEAANGSADQEVIAAQGTGQKIFVRTILIQVTAVATGGGGEVALEDGAGGTRFFEADADALGVYSHDFGEPGYPLTANTALNLTVDGAVTTQATARATVTGYVVR